MAKGTALAKTKNKALASASASFFAAYGDAAPAGGNIVGDLLIHSKGEWQRGQDKDEVDEGTRIIVNMDTLLTGWVRWSDQKPVEQRMGPLAEGYQPEKRSELGYTDEKEWETDDRGEPRDPWVFSNQFLCKGEDDGGIMTFSTSSKGGITAVQRMCKTFGEDMIEHAGENPVIELGVDSYLHKSFGKTYVPVLKIVDWSEDNDFTDRSETKPKNGKASTNGKKKASTR